VRDVEATALLQNAPDLDTTLQPPGRHSDHTQADRAIVEVHGVPRRGHLSQCRAIHQHLALIAVQFLGVLYRHQVKGLCWRQMDLCRVQRPYAQLSTSEIGP
jgi:hypothetical protein